MALPTAVMAVVAASMRPTGDGAPTPGDGAAGQGATAAQLVGAEVSRARRGSERRATAASEGAREERADRSIAHDGTRPAGAPSPYAIGPGGRVALLRPGAEERVLMFDGHWRKPVNQGLAPIGAALRRAGVTADAITITGIAMSAACAIALGHGPVPRGPRPARADRGARRPRRCRGPGRRRGQPSGAPSSTRCRTASPTPCSSAACAWHLAGEGGHIVMLPVALCGAASLISYQRAKAESLGFDAKGGIMERAERFIVLGVGPAVLRAAGRRAVGHAGAVALHHGPALREGVAPGRPAGVEPAPLPAHPAAHLAPCGRALAHPARCPARPADRLNVPGPRRPVREASPVTSVPALRRVSHPLRPPRLPARFAAVPQPAPPRPLPHLRDGRADGVLAHPGPA